MRNIEGVTFDAKIIHFDVLIHFVGQFPRSSCKPSCFCGAKKFDQSIMFLIIDI